MGLHQVFICFIIIIFILFGFYGGSVSRGMSSLLGPFLNSVRACLDMATVAEFMFATLVYK